MPEPLTDEELAEILTAHERMQAAPWPDANDPECGRAGKVWTDCAIRYMGRLYNEVWRLRAENADLRKRVDSLKAGCALANEIMERQEAARREASYDERGA